jgi:DNA-binding transcriptional LysR family regulator
MSGFELRHLRYFVAVAEEGHFGRAAERVGIAQPPLTQQIHKLEAIVGECLFERRPRVRLTPAGEAFLEGARRILAQAEEAVAVTRRAGSGSAGSLTVGFPASALLTIVPDVVRRYHEQYPGVELKLREMSTAAQLEALANRTIDVGFLRQAPTDLGELSCALSFAEPFCVVLPFGHPLAERPNVRLAELGEEPFVLFPQSVAPGLHRQVHELCQSAGFMPRVVQEAQEWLTIVGLVEAGIGLSIVPASFRRLRWGGVQYLGLADAEVTTTVSLVSAAGPARPTALRFIELATHVMSAASDLAQVGRIYGNGFPIPAATR